MGVREVSDTSGVEGKKSSVDKGKIALVFICVIIGLVALYLGIQYSQLQGRYYELNASYYATEELCQS